MSKDRANHSLANHNEERKKILVVDDEADISAVIKIGLEKTGDYDVDAFTDPEQALTSFKPNTYDLLVIDIKMPKMTGFQLYKKLFKIDSKPKVCFITAFEMYYDEFRKVFPSLDVKCFITKPITISDLIKQVNAEFAQLPYAPQKK